MSDNHVIKCLSAQHCVEDFRRITSFIITTCDGTTW